MSYHTNRKLLDAMSTHVRRCEESSARRRREGDAGACGPMSHVRCSINSYEGD